VEHLSWGKDVAMQAKYTFTASLWLYPGKAGWHFVTVPQDVSDDIGTLFEGLSRGWGSFPATITIGETRWQTSIFPDKASATFLLPLKAEVRKKERIAEGDTVSVLLELDV
jgi:hypothetical protein